MCKYCNGTGKQQLLNKVVDCDQCGLTTENGVIALMRSSRNSREWEANCDRVKAANDGGYPEFWFRVFLRGGLMNEILGPGSDKITVHTLPPPWPHDA